jgi:hypothetical protein
MTELWCYIEGKQNSFFISISYHLNIDALKKEIYKTGSSDSKSFVECNAKDFTLTKVRYCIS